MDLRYNLDKLGWYQFEGLVQSILKASLGFGVEAWGGNGDFGRDAYFEGRLNYPANKEEDGPFLFQCKFVIAANSAGAKPNPQVRKAVTAEIDNIKTKLPDSNESQTGKLEKKRWVELPTHYTLFCNAVIRSEIRTDIKNSINSILPNTIVHIHDGNDICAWIDNFPDLLKSYPAILGITDIDRILNSRLNKAVFERSRVAIEMAKELVPVFFPTEAYNKAQDILDKFHFVILEGAPEMGKTAIGRMISLSFVLDGWEALECRTPVDFLNAYDENKRQIFLADDFFGRTEYDPERVSKWQSDLPIIIRKINKTHLLILTSRMHLINMGKSKLDLGSDQLKFPGLSELSVDAGNLTTTEKALILYRHAKNAGLELDINTVVKENALAIINNEYFTPERIRRLINNVLSKSETFS